MVAVAIWGQATVVGQSVIMRHRGLVDAAKDRAVSVFTYWVVPIRVNMLQVPSRQMMGVANSFALGRVCLMNGCSFHAEG